jgi:hypothetical protein
VGPWRRRRVQAERGGCGRTEASESRLGPCTANEIYLWSSQTCIATPEARSVFGLPRPFLFCPAKVVKFVGPRSGACPHQKKSVHTKRRSH